MAQEISHFTENQGHWSGVDMGTGPGVVREFVQWMALTSRIWAKLVGNDMMVNVREAIVVVVVELYMHIPLSHHMP